MGREIRRVPANWEHPKEKKYNFLKQREEENYHPLHDHPYIEAINEWIENHQLWEKGEHPDQQGKDRSTYEYFAQWDGDPPEVEYYRPNWKAEEMAWFQVYETVSEGTPVTPPFSTKEMLVDYLVENGDFWDQKRGDGGWKREIAEKFVDSEWAPSFIVINTEQEQTIKAPRDGM